MSRGLTLLEIMVTLGVVAAILVVVMESMQVMAIGVKSSQASSDLSTRTTGTLYDIVSELRQAAAYSPNFNIEQDIARPPSITFDLVAGVDGKGNIVWGNKVTYALQLMPEPEASQFDYLGVDAGQLIRTETNSLGVSTITLVEDCVPYQYMEPGISSWGFAVSRDGNALSISLSRFADSGAPSGHTYQNVSDGSTLKPSVNIVRTTGIYFLRNPQSVIVLN